ncbi:MAG TPA: MFS transporter, partial [Acidimicrobiales bacterium]|nr:MFS transporter [Acidimicrobiales bacterium]
MPSAVAPLKSSYATKVTMVLLSLCPYIVVTTAATLMQKPLIKDLHTSKTALEMAGGLANAGYAFGAVLAALLIKKMSMRPLLISFEVLFVAGSVLAAVAPDTACFTSGRVLQGFATGMMLVVALPPLVTGFGVSKLPYTVGIIDMALFGATTLGPLIGGDVGAHGSWRLFFWGLAALGLLGIAVQAASVDATDPLRRDASPDLTGIGLAVAATVLPFIGSSFLASEPVISWYFLPFTVVGLAALVALLIVEYKRADPVTPVKMLAHSFPVTGIFVAMFTGAAAVAMLELVEEFLLQGLHTQPLAAGELLWPQIVAVILAAAIFGAVLRTRHITTLAAVGTLVLVAGALGLAFTSHRTGHGTILLIAASIGFGAGATVSPGLFMAGLSMPSTQLGPTFALVELLRSEAAFLVAPILLHVSLGQGTKRPQLDHGISVAGWALV